MCGYRLKSKQEEWLEAQRSFNKLWRDQLEKYYLKVSRRDNLSLSFSYSLSPLLPLSPRQSLDYQGINFKALDTRAMRSKSLVCEIESVFDERQEQMAENFASNGPHLSFTFPVSSPPPPLSPLPLPLSISLSLSLSLSPSLYLSPLSPQSEQRVFADAVGLVMYYLKRASSMQREDAVKIRSFLTQTLADFCYYEK